jgi:cyclopropane-fatty-acyl-phospholipid synthase
MIKDWLLGPVYAGIRRMLDEPGAVDPRQAIALVSETLEREPPGPARTAAAVAYFLAARLRHRARRSQAIATHYDLPPAFFALFLDREYRAYSCAIWDDDCRTLEAAQRRKLDVLARKLDVKPGHTVLDVGCGWGSFLRYANERGFDAQGLTLSRAQVAECRRLGYRAEYGDAADAVPGAVDRIVSIGMMEHAKNRREQILGHCFRALPPGGRMVVQEICDGPEPGNLPATVFAAEECFPGDGLASYLSVQRAARRVGFEVAHLECFGPHYRATTLEWARRLAERFDEATALVGYRTAMMHLLCQAGFAWYFAVGAIDLVQYILVKPA